MKTTISIAALAALFVSPVILAAPVNINSASAEQIAEALIGIGPGKAQAIVEYRETNGRFVQADEIVFVRGIGESTYLKNKADILVE